MVNFQPMNRKSNIRKPALRYLLISLVLCSLLTSNLQSFASERVSFNYTPIPAGQVGKYSVMAGEIWGEAATYSVPPSATHSYYSALFPVCDGNKYSNCIVSFESKKISDETWVSASVEYSETKNSPGTVAIQYANGSAPQLVGNIDEDIVKGIPTGRSSSVWSAPNAPHNGGSQYLLSVRLNTFPYDVYSAPTNFSVGIQPIKYDPSSRKSYGPLDSAWAYGTSFNFPENQEFRIKVKLGLAAQQISTFFSGRVNSPEFNIENGILSISGSPQSYPLAQSEVLDYKDLSNLEKDSIEIWKEDFFRSKSAVGGIFNDSADPFSKFIIWESRLKQIGLTQSWFISSMKNTYDCKVSTLAGFISSNALFYSRTPPTWDSNNSTINYRMASLHTDANGDINRGNLDLVLSPELIQCLWKFDPKNLQSVEVQVIYNNGESIIGTSILREINGWVYVNVRGYTFSSPNISVKLIPKQGTPDITTTQKQESKTRSDNVEQPTKTRITITCVKGKLTKKVSAVIPKCPAGYKKK